MNTVVELLGGGARTRFQAPLPAGTGLSTALVTSFRRETTLAWARTGAGHFRRDPLLAHRMPAPRLAGGVREALRRHLGAGWISSTAHSTETVLAEVLSTAHVVPVSPPSVGADGSVRLGVTRDGRPAILRIGAAHTPEDPRRARRALVLLESVDNRLAPRPLESGRVGALAWSIEERLPGRRPPRLERELLRDAVDFTCHLPGGPGRHSPSASAAGLLDAAPGHADQLRDVSHLIAASDLASHPVLRHGDFWLGNCLQGRDGHLSGVVDWDAWTPTALPGSDLLHLLATEERLRRRVPLGTVWLSSPWDTPEFVEIARRCWPDWADDPTARRTVGLDWWLHHVAADVRRVPGRASDVRWVQANVTLVLADVRC